MSLSFRCRRIQPIARCFFGTLFIAAITGTFTAAWSQSSFDPGLRPVTNNLVIELFRRDSSEQCNRAEQFLRQLQQRRAGIELKIRDVEEDRDALLRLWQISRRFGREKAGVPTVYLAKNLIVGFRDDQTTGQEIESLLRIRAFVRPGCEHCRQAKEFLEVLCQRWPAISVQYDDVLTDAKARAEVSELTQRYQVRAVSFPVIQVAGRLSVGFQNAATTGARIEGYFQPENEKDKDTDAAQGQTKGKVSAAPRSGVRLASVSANPLGFLGKLRSSLAWPSGPRISVEVPGTTTGPTNVPRLQGERPAEAVSLPEDAPLPEDVPLPEAVPLPEDVPLPEAVPPPDDVPEDVPLPEEVPFSEGVLPGESNRSANQNDVLTDAAEAIEVPLLGRLRVQQLGLPAFTFLIGLVDGFNPCAMWVLVFLLSVLVNIKERQKIIVIAGTFVVVSGLAYFAFMAAWFSVFQLVGLLRPVQIGLGLVALLVGAVNIKDFFAFHKGVSLSIPDAAKPGIYRRVREIVAARNLLIALFGRHRVGGRCEFH